MLQRDSTKCRKNDRSKMIAILLVSLLIISNSIEIDGQGRHSSVVFPPPGFRLHLCLIISSSWNLAVHPFPEMSRFLNLNSRIHAPVKTKSTFSMVDYLCRWDPSISLSRHDSSPFFSLSIADRPDQINRICRLFGEKYRRMIRKIVERDCWKAD